MKYYVASCVFTAKHPQVSARILEYIAPKSDMYILRCCVPDWRVHEYEEKMPEGRIQETWRNLPETGALQPGDEVWSLCHNCSNIIEEQHPGVQVNSLGELIAQDADFPFPDYVGPRVTLQDCWRAGAGGRAESAGQDACGICRGKRAPCTDRFLRLFSVPAAGGTQPQAGTRHYAQEAQGKFLSHTEEGQRQIMQAYCSQYPPETVVCYCHYCMEGPEVGGMDARHIAHMLFPGNG